MLSTGCLVGDQIIAGSPPPFPPMPAEAVAELEKRCEWARPGPIGPDGFPFGHPCPGLSLWLRELARYDCAIARQRGDRDPTGCEIPEPKRRR